MIIRPIAYVIVVILALLVIGCTQSPELLDSHLPIPAQSDWTDYGTIFEAGELGEWDYLLYGGFTVTAVKKEGTYYLYYQGASGYRSTSDETVTWRAIGGASSPDGINFTKFNHNPILTWFPNNNGEEGAVSGGVTLDDSGKFMLYYGANTEVSVTSINGDGRLATSEDGLNFTDGGLVLDHKDSSLWGSGDELFPIVAFHDAGQWFVYYIPNGSLQRGKLGVAWGLDPTKLTNSSAAARGMSSISVWGSGGIAKINDDTYALFLNDIRRSILEVRTISPSIPQQLSDPVETYQFDEVKQSTVLLDPETKTWFMYYRGEDTYGLKLAPFGNPDTSPPSAPNNVTATPTSDRQIDLSWAPATDADTGIVQYKVFRDGVYLAPVKGWSFTDTGLKEQTGYRYEISAINYHGMEGPRSAPISARTLVDVAAPQLISVNASGPSDKVVVIFNEALEQASAETAANYTINGNISVTKASLASDLKTITLTTSDHANNVTYGLTANNVQDQAETPNAIVPDTEVNYTYSRVAGLVGAWTFDEGKGEVAFDIGNYRNNGRLVYTNKPGPTWTGGKFGSALQFDGADDQVTIDGIGVLENSTDGSHTFVAWAKPDGVPPNTTVNDTAYSILVRGYTGLYYNHTQSFRASIRLQDGTEVSISSESFNSGEWYQLTMVVDDQNKKLHLYINGHEVSASPVSYNGALADHEDAPYYIGTSEPLTELYEYRFRGTIDEIRIYNRALTSVEAKSLFLHFSIYLPVYHKTTIQIK